MDNNKIDIIRIKNDQITNRLTAPENKLIRPKIHYLKIFIIVISASFLDFIFSFIIVIIIKEIKLVKINSLSSFILCFLLIYVIWIFLLILIFIKFILIQLIRFYQRFVRSETRLKCNFIPSCSEYGILALKKYGVIFGTIKTIKRLLRCKPPGGIDYP